MRPATPPPEVYPLHVWWRESSPMIWRRLLVRSDSIIAHRHYILQMAMGWEGYRLHQFIIRGKRYAIPQPGGLGFPDDSTQVRLADLRLRLRERFHILPDLEEYHLAAQRALGLTAFPIPATRLPAALATTRRLIQRRHGLVAREIVGR